MKRKTINELVAEFAESVVKQNEAIWRRDPSTGNKFADSYADAFKELHALGNSGLAALASLLDDKRVDVRTMAAAFLVPYMTNDAVKVLEEASEGQGIVALGAEMALKRWHEEGKGIEFD
jgi:hypothetical protein